jgi:sulfonate transport system substrate-binding protein
MLNGDPVMSLVFPRRGLALLGAVAALSFAVSAKADDGYPDTLRIGYQNGNTLVIVKGSGALEKALASHHVTVEWHEFATGAPLVEALAAGSVDMGFVGAPPPVFAQAGGAPNLVYIGYAAPYKDNYAIIVAKDAKAGGLADLKGQRIAVQKGSAGEFLLLQAIEKSGLQRSDFAVTYLAYGDARAAFGRGDVAAWVVQDPRLADTQKATGAKTLITAGDLTPQYSYYVAPRAFAQKYPAVLRAALDQTDATEKAIPSHLAEDAAILEKNTHVPADVWQVALKRWPVGVAYPLTQEVVTAQQGVADTFYKYHLIPKPVHVADAVVSIR